MQQFCCRSSTFHCSSLLLYRLH